MQPNDRLSRTASQLAAVNRDLAANFDEIAAFHAPSECYGSACAAAVRAASRILRAQGWSAREFDRRMRERVSARWLHFNFVGAQELVGYHPIWTFKRIDRAACRARWQRRNEVRKTVRFCWRVRDENGTTGLSTWTAERVS